MKNLGNYTSVFVVVGNYSDVGRNFNNSEKKGLVIVERFPLETRNDRAQNLLDFILFFFS